MSIQTALRLINEMVEEGVIANYAVGGAVAAANYVDLMPTVDLDVFVEVKSRDSLIDDPTPIFAFFAKKGHRMEGEYVNVDGWPIQFLGPPGELGEDALDAAITVDADGLQVRILSAEYLAAIALQSGRPKDRARLLGLLDFADFDRKLFEAIIDKHRLEPQWSAFKREFEIR